MKLRAICFPGHTITSDLNPVLNTRSLLGAFPKSLQNMANTSFEREALLNISFAGVAHCVHHTYIA